MSNTIRAEYSIDSVPDFLTKLYPHVGDLAYSAKVVFRGQSENKLLRSGLLRQLIPVNDNGTTTKPPEWKLEEIRRAEDKAVSAFKRQSPPFLSFNPKNILEWLAIGQHHGLATRLLDWAENPLTALFFAVANVSFHKENGVVWAFSGSSLDGMPDIQTLDEFDALYRNGIAAIYYPTHINPRIVAQQGCFTVQNMQSDDYWLGLQEPHDDIRRDYTLVKFNIPADTKPQFRNELETLGINYLSLFPDLDGLSRKLNWLYIEPRLRHSATK